MASKERDAFILGGYSEECERATRALFRAGPRNVNDADVALRREILRLMELAYCAGAGTAWDVDDSKFLPPATPATQGA